MDETLQGTYPSAQPRQNTAAAAASNSPEARNVRSIADLIDERRRSLSAYERVGRVINQVVGSLWFVFGHAVAMITWATWNAAGPAEWRFDPYPFPLLTMLVSLEGVLVAAFIVVNQNRLGAEADRVEHLHLQISLLNEQEITHAIRILGGIAQRMQVPVERGVDQLLRDTDINVIVGEIERKMPAD